MCRSLLKTVVVSMLLLTVWELLASSNSMQASGAPANQPLVQGISIHYAPNGAAVIDVTLTHSVPYRTLQLSNPERLVVDLRGAHEADLRRAYPAQSELLKRVRVSQWKNNPPVVRVVADLIGKFSFRVTTQASGIHIELRHRSLAWSSKEGLGRRGGGPDARASRPGRQTLHEDPPPQDVLPVHQFKDLSASLTAPALPPHDRLIPVTVPHPSKLRHQPSPHLARVSGITVKPASRGVINVDIASTRSVPYRVFQLAHPFRLVVDLKDARNASPHDVYQVDSPVLKRIRVAQWHRGSSPVVRVVADLQGYPVFDVYAQRPGVRIEIRPRHSAPPRFRNPFQFSSARSMAQAGRQAGGNIPTAEVAASSRSGGPGYAFSDLKVIGFVEKKDSGIQAVIADRSSLYFVPTGGAFGNAFIVVAISPNGVEIQKIRTSEKTWLIYTPGQTRDASHADAR